jgi:pyocin large subunit-like protein
MIYKAATNEFAVVAKDNVIRTYFKPVDGVLYFLGLRGRHERALSD